MNKDLENCVALAAEQSREGRSSTAAHTPGALRAAYLIGAQLAGRPNHPSFWTTATYNELAALIDSETAAPDMYAALEMMLAMHGGLEQSPAAKAARAALRKANGGAS